MMNQQAMAAGLMLDDEGISLSLHSEKPVPPPFLTKTYHLVDDANTDHIVSWGDRDDSTFVVWRPPEFARDLLPNYFKHSNFSSFVRQLNTYGFRKMVPDRWEFANEFFKKGEKHLLCEIQRRKTSSSHHLSGQTYFPYYPTRLSDVSPPESDSWREENSPPALSLSSLVALSEDNERLRRSNGVLAAELAHMRKLYNDIIYFVQNHVKPVSPSSSLFLSQVNVIDHDAAGAGGCRSTTKLFGVPLHSSNETNKASLVPEKNHDLGFNLML